jgi:hypothetical protein
MQHLFQDQAAKALLERCSAIYLALANRIPKLKRKGDAERIMEWVQLTASFCWLAHPGRYADGRIENAAFAVGERLDDFLPANGAAVELAEPVPSAPRRVLHVATSVYNTGGHTRLIKNWVERDENSHHHLLLTNQETSPLPGELTQAVEQRHGKVMVLPKSLSMLERASYLRNVARANFDVVVLHTNPDDVVPIVALASRDVPPVALLNHADHVFWIGSSIADVIVDLRTYGQRLSETRRYAKQTFMLPIPLNLKQPSISREEARRRLNLTETDVMLLSIGAAYKYIPTPTHNFYQTISNILERNPEAHFYQVGIDQSTSAQFLPQRHARAHFLGRLEDPTLYEVAADIYLEGFPQGSLTAMLETAALGVSTVLMYAPPIPNADMAETLGGKDSVRSTESEDEYIGYVTELIENAEKRTSAGRQFSEFIVSTHSSVRWRAQLEEIYSYLGRVGHRPTPIPNSDFMATADDLGLSVLSNSPYGKTSPILSMANVNFDKISRAAIVNLFYASLSSRETRASYAPMRNWFGMWKHKTFGTSRTGEDMGLN